MAREIASNGPLHAFPWAPFSILAERFADKEILFHLLLAPFAWWPLERAALAGVVIGQVLFFLVVATFLARLQLPLRWGVPCLLAMSAIGGMFAFRMNLCRPHLMVVGGSVAVFALLALLDHQRSVKALWALAGLMALLGLAHTGGWIGILYAAIYGGASVLVPRSAPPADRALRWRPAAFAGGGWLLGQLAHPNLPHNFELLWLQNVVVPFQASGAGSRELEAVIGAELLPLPPALLWEQWPALVAPVAAALLLLRYSALRRRLALALTLVAFSLLLASALYLQRLFELGAPLGVLALAATLAEAERSALATATISKRVAKRSRGAAPEQRAWWQRRGMLLAGGFLLLGWLSTSSAIRRQSLGVVSPPLAMARFLGSDAAQAAAGDRVFTAQWGDSAPLFYFAPKVRSVVALDPTFFFVKDRALFELFVKTAFGQTPEPAAVIQHRFGARWVTIWKAPLYGRLAQSLGRTPTARLVYDDAFYQVWDLGQPGN